MEILQLVKMHNLAVLLKMHFLHAANCLRGCRNTKGGWFCCKFSKCNTMGFSPMSPVLIRSGSPSITTTTAINALSATSTIVPPLLPYEKSSTFLLPSPSSTTTASFHQCLCPPLLLFLSFLRLACTATI